MSLAVVNLAVDSVYLSLAGDINKEVIRRLEESKTSAQVENENVEFEIEGETFALRPRSVGFYAFALIGPNCTIKLSTSKNIPAVYLEINAVYLYEHGHTDAVDRLLSLIGTLGTFEEPKISRIDLCADFQGWELTTREIKNFVSRVNKKHYFETHGKLSSVYFGRKILLCRIYNKTLQVAEKQGKGEEIYHVWRKSPLFTEALTVWRVEFQIRRAALKTFDCPDCVEGVFDHLAGIWLYLTNDWLTLRVPKKETRRERWLVDPRWQKLQSYKTNVEPCRRVKDAKNLSDLSRAVSRVKSALATIGAITNDTSLRSVSRFTADEIDLRYERWNSSFSEDVEKQRLRNMIESF